MASWQEVCTYLQYSNSAIDRPLFDGFDRFTWAAVQGALLAAMLLIATSYFRHGQKPVHPGHWILLLNSLLIPVALLAHTVLSIQINRFGDDTPSWVYTVNNTIYLLFNLCFTLIWLALCRGAKHGWSWLFVCALFLVLSVVTTFGYLSATISGHSIPSALVYAIQFVILIAGTVAVAIDLLNGERRDWLHWFGMAVTLVAFSLNPLRNVLEFMAAFAT